MKRSDKRKRDPRLTERTVRPGCKVMKLDPTKTGEPRFPWQRKRKRQAKENRNVLEHLRRVGRVSMIQIGEDEFRTPNRAERRAAGIRHRGKNPLTTMHYGAPLRQPVQLPETEQIQVARETSMLLRMRPYTRKAKATRRAIAEQNALCEGLT